MCKSIHFWIYIRKCTCFFSTIGDDGSRQCRSVAASFVRVFWNSSPKTTCVENFSHKSSMNSLQYIFHITNWTWREKCIQYIFPVIKNLHKKTAYIFSTIGDDGSRQCPSESPIFVRILRFPIHNSRLVEHFSHESSINSLQCIFHDTNWT